MSNIASPADQNVPPLMTPLLSSSRDGENVRASPSLHSQSNPPSLITHCTHVDRTSFRSETLLDFQHFSVRLQSLEEISHGALSPRFVQWTVSVAYGLAALCGIITVSALIRPSQESHGHQAVRPPVAYYWGV